MGSLNPVEVMTAGELFIDLIMSGFDVWPQPGRESFAREFHRQIGGGAAITACGLGKLGMPTSVLGVVGLDDGPWIMAQLQRFGVDVSDMLFHPSEPTAFTVVATMPEDRAFLTYPGANRGFPDALMAAATGQRLAHARHVHLAFPPYLETAAELMKTIHRNGCTVSLDVGWHEDWLTDSRAVALLPLIDVFLPNEAEATLMMGSRDPGECLRRFEKAGAHCVPLKLGARGSAVRQDGEIVFAPSPPVTPVDTTGAGDCFDAGFLYARMRGEALVCCLQSGNICGALSTEAYGGIAAFPTKERLQQELKSYSCAK